MEKHSLNLSFYGEDIKIYKKMEKHLSKQKGKEKFKTPFIIKCIKKELGL